MNEVKTIAHIYNDFPEKFGLPRQGICAGELRGRIVFEEEYRDINALKGMEEYDRIWILWIFDVYDESFRPMVRPPKLGGNEYRGVFATRSPHRPNPIAMTCARIVGIAENESDLERFGVTIGKGDPKFTSPEIIVSGIDMVSGTKLIDIKPYIPYADSFPDARGGFSLPEGERQLEVHCEEGVRESLLERLGDYRLGVLTKSLAEDPRPGYKTDENSENTRIYGMKYAGLDLHFRVENGILFIVGFEEDSNGNNIF